jgi:hypothetical protein
MWAVQFFKFADYLLTPWSRVLLEKLIGSQLVKKFPALYGTGRIITAFTRARHPALSWATQTQSILSHPASWRSILVLSFHLHLCLPSGSIPQVSPPKPCIELYASAQYIIIISINEKLMMIYDIMSLKNSTLLTADTLLWCTKILFQLMILACFFTEKIIILCSFRAPVIPPNLLHTHTHTHTH